MIAIVNLDKNNGIGKDGKLLAFIKEDMKRFRELTTDNVVVMGRKTLFSFKDKAPLKNRINIVFTTNTELKNEYKNYDNIFFVQNVQEMNKLLKNYEGKQVFLIGGAKIYNDLIDQCDTVLATQMDKAFEADVFFPNLKEHGFKITEESETFSHENINYKFVTYRKD